MSLFIAFSSFISNETREVFCQLNNQHVKIIYKKHLLQLLFNRSDFHWVKYLHTYSMTPPQYLMALWVFLHRGSQSTCFLSFIFIFFNESHLSTSCYVDFARLHATRLTCDHVSPFLWFLKSSSLASVFLDVFSEVTYHTSCY